jgi:phosphoribosylpyrophosphate synthetase
MVLVGEVKGKTAILIDDMVCRQCVLVSSSLIVA